MQPKTLSSIESTLKDVQSDDVSRAAPEESDTTKSEIHKSEILPVTSRVTSVPDPAGIVDPVKLNPITVEPPVETVKPELPAAPPDAPFNVTPLTLN